MTNAETSANVRFYFRPKTPTQYYNEGYKPKALRYENDINANVPVPVFLAFELEKLLHLPKTIFSELSQAGSGAPLYRGAEAFAKLNFDKIYSVGVCDKETIKYRHAELLYPGEFEIEPSLYGILCRNDIEKQTLLTMLRLKHPEVFYKYQAKIRICKADMFENNGLFITECRYYKNTVYIVFSDTSAKKAYVDKMFENQSSEYLKKVHCLAEFNWRNTKNVVAHRNVEFHINYMGTNMIKFENLPKVEQALFITIKIYIEDNLMCYITQNLLEMELL